MFNFFDINGYQLTKRTIKDGFSDFKLSFFNIKAEIKVFSILFVLFLSLNFLKSWSAVSAISQQSQDLHGSVILSSSSMSSSLFIYMTYILTFLTMCILPIFTIKFLQNKQEKKLTLIKDSFLKVIDFRLYIISIFIFFFAFLSLRIAFQPIFTAVPSLNIETGIHFFTELNTVYSSNIAAGQHAVNEAMYTLVQSNEKYKLIFEQLQNINIPKFLSFFFFSAILFITTLIICIFSLFNLIVFPNISFLESIKIAIYINTKNALYTATASIGIIFLVFIKYLIPDSIPLVHFIITSIISLYTVFIFSFIIKQTVKEKDFN